jgi:hypothetical protein
MPSVATWFQVDIDSCAFRQSASFFECQYFGVPDSVVPVKALAHDQPILHDDGTDKRVRPYVTLTLGRERQRQIQKTEVEIAVSLGFRWR